MSCLPFAAWAAKKAAQLVGESGGGSSGGPVMVELTGVEIGEITDETALTQLDQIYAQSLPSVNVKITVDEEVDICVNCMALFAEGALAGWVGTTTDGSNLRVTIASPVLDGVWVFATEPI